MISCIICSRERELSVDFQSNIANTIGENYEIIVIDNSNSQYTIFEAYNEGVRRAIGDVICFMHDDIRFHTNNWGKISSSILLDYSIGMVGVSGCHFLPQTPIYWPESPFITSTNFDFVNNIEYHDARREFIGEKKLIDVVVCDGMWFCIPKYLFEMISFDSEVFDGFHMYDMDISMQVQKSGLRVVVSNGIKIEHNSRGNFDVPFYKALSVFYNKWHSYFPISKGITEIPDYSLAVINNLYVLSNKYKSNYEHVVRSKNYRLGYYFMLPLRKLLSIIK